MQKLSLRLLLPVLALIAFPAISNAAVLIATHDNNTLKSAATTVQTNGGSVGLKESISGQGNSRTGFFKFNATGYSEGIDGSSATLKLSVSTASTTDFTLRFFVLKPGAGYDWDQTTITWNNSPAFSSDSTTNYLTAARVQQLGANVSVASGTAVGTAISVNLTNWSTYLQADNTLTFIVVAVDQDDAGPQFTFASSENATSSLRPTLTIIPEPGTLTLVAFSALGLIRRFRR